MHDALPIDRYELQERYIALTRGVLPTLAVERHWPIREDHCFMRIVLDHLFQDCWYHHLDRRLRAYRQLQADQLREAIRIAEHMQTLDAEAIEQMNRQSLRWRGKVIR